MTLIKVKKENIELEISDSDSWSTSSLRATLTHIVDEVIRLTDDKFELKQSEDNE